MGQRARLGEAREDEVKEEKDSGRRRVADGVLSGRSLSEEAAYNLAPMSIY